MLVRDELKLAQLEMTRKSKQAGLDIRMLVGSGLVALCVMGCLVASAIMAIGGVAGGADLGRGLAGCRRGSGAAG